MKAYGRFWRYFFNYRARARRADFWWPLLINFLIVYFLITFVRTYAESHRDCDELLGVCIVTVFVFFLGTVSCTARRLHTIGVSRAAVLWIALPGAGWLVLFWYMLRSDTAACRKAGHVWEQEKENCREVCARCGETRTAHTFEGCTCKYCGLVRDESHAFEYIKEKCADICSRCGKSLEHHDWNGCTCRVCNTHRDEGHDWHRVKGTCKRRCALCGREIEDQHTWKFLQDGVCRKTCTRCGATADGEHDYVWEEKNESYNDGDVWVTNRYRRCRRCGRITDSHDYYFGTNIPYGEG